MTLAGNSVRDFKGSASIHYEQSLPSRGLVSKVNTLGSPKAMAHLSAEINAASSHKGACMRPQRCSCGMQTVDDLVSPPDFKHFSHKIDEKSMPKIVTY